MTSLLASAFEHHTWATLRLIETCRRLPAPALETPVPGTFGSLLETLRHYLAGDAFYLAVANGRLNDPIAHPTATLDQLTALATETGLGWQALLAGDPAPDLLLREVDPDDGFTRDGPLGVLLAEQLHHGNEHRAQCCLALAALGFEPPDLSGWAFGAASGLVEELPPGG